MLTRSCVLRDSDEIESFFLSSTGMKPGFFQLSPGLINLQMDLVTLDGVTLIWTNSEGRQRWRDTMTEDGLHLAFAVRSEGFIRFRGRDVDPNEVAIWHKDEEMDFLMQGPLTSLDVGIEKDLMDELGWRVSSVPLSTVQPIHLRSLLQICSLATEEMNAKTAAHEGGGRTAYWRDQVLSAIEALIAPWETWRSSPHTLNLSRDFVILKNVEDYFEGLADPGSFDIDGLSQELGIPKRTLFRSLRRSVGLGPRKYFELKRIYQLRSQLRTADPENATVTQLANDQGFTELGRMAGLYRTHFGETPIETLKKRYN